MGLHNGSSPDFDVLVIGSGFAGLCLAIHLKRAGKSCLILERGPDVGGTWRVNTYPGCACDIPPHLVELVTDAIAQVRERSIVTADGTERPVDALVYATGFRATDLLSPVRFVGRGGIALDGVTPRRVFDFRKKSLKVRKPRQEIGRRML